MALSRQNKTKKTWVERDLERRGITNLPSEFYNQVERAMGAGYTRSALIEQNWIIIKQNQQILDELKKLNDK